VNKAIKPDCRIVTIDYGHRRCIELSALWFVSISWVAAVIFVLHDETTRTTLVFLGLSAQGSLSLIINPIFYRRLPTRKSYLLTYGSIIGGIAISLLFVSLIRFQYPFSNDLHFIPASSSLLRQTTPINDRKLITHTAAVVAVFVAIVGYYGVIAFR